MRVRAHRRSQAPIILIMGNVRRSGFVEKIAIVCCGCAAGSIPDDETVAVAQELGGTQTVVNPASSYTAEVTANGTGCPSGTWEPRISADGKVLRVRFRYYYAYVEKGQAFAIRDCNVVVTLKTPSGDSFAFSSLTSYGSAWMAPDVSAKATLRHAVRGGPAPAPAKEMKVFGDPARFVEYRVEETFAERERVWSPCGTSSTLTALTRLILLNNPDRTGWGYAGEIPDDAEIPPVELVIGIAQKHC
jgi:hypothetical protein